MFSFQRSVRSAPYSVVAVCVALVSLFACQSPLPIPRIEPVLERWETPYVGMDGLKLHVFNTGTMRLPRGVVYAGGSWTKMQRMDASAFVIEHPTEGLIVFDTGLNPKVRTDLEAYLGWTYAQLDVIEAEPGTDLPTSMRRVGLDPAKVRFVVISHLHFDHAGTVESFPAAEVVVAEKEKPVAFTDDLEALAYKTEDWDEVRNWQLLDLSNSAGFATFVGHHDLLGDGSLVIVDLAGHTPGSIGLLIRLGGAPVLLTGDAVWVEKNWRYAARPAFAHDMARWWEQVWRIKKFAQLEPSLVVVPGHDLGVFDRVELPGIVRHDTGGQNAAGPNGAVGAGGGIVPAASGSAQAPAEGSRS